MSRRPARRSATPPIWFDGPLPRVIAHRGLAIDAPENTLLAFLKALAIGVDYVETDVHATRDGIAVLCHDPNLRRIAGRMDQIRTMTMEQLRQIDLGDGQTLSSLAEALDAFPDARFNIDIKSADAVEPTAAAILEARATERVLVTSFSERRRRAALRLLPGVATAASASRFALALTAGKLGPHPLLRFTLRDVHAVQVPVSVRGVRITTPRMIRRLHAAGVEVHVWTINDEDTISALLDLGVDGIFTDRADLAIALVAARS